MHDNQVENQIICVKVNITMWLLPAVPWMNPVNTIKSLFLSLSHRETHARPCTRKEILHLLPSYCHSSSCLLWMTSSATTQH